MLKATAGPWSSVGLQLWKYCDSVVNPSVFHQPAAIFGFNVQLTQMTNQPITLQKRSALRYTGEDDLLKSKASIRTGEVKCFKVTLNVVNVVVGARWAAGVPQTVAGPLGLWAHHNHLGGSHRMRKYYPVSLLMLEGQRSEWADCEVMEISLYSQWPLY